MPGLHVPYLVTVALWSLVMVVLFLESPLGKSGKIAGGPLGLAIFQGLVWSLHVLWLCRLYRDLERWKVARRPLHPLGLVVVTALAALLPLTLVWSVCALGLLLRATERRLHALARQGVSGGAELSLGGLQRALARQRHDLRALVVGAFLFSCAEILARAQLGTAMTGRELSRSDLLGPEATLLLCLLSLMIALWYLWWLARTIPVLYRSYALIMGRR